MCTEELASPPRVDLDWKQPESVVSLSDGTESMNTDHRHDNEGRPTWPREQTLVKLLCEFVVGMPALTEVESIRVWLQQPGDLSMRLELLMDNFTGKQRASMDLPLDEAITNWVWQHQRPLIIAAERNFVSRISHNNCSNAASSTSARSL